MNIKISFVIFTLLCSLNMLAQDMIYLNSSDSILAKVLTIKDNEISYHKWNNLEGPIYSISTNEVAAIRYANGTYDFFTPKDINVTQDKKKSSVMLTRAGNTYYYDNMVMGKRTMLEWLEKQNCPAAYNQFQRGYNTAQTGWVFMAAGLSFDLVGAILRGIRIEQGIPGIIFMALGGALELACIPTIAVGYSKMHQTVNVYNVSCSTSSKPKSYWALQAGNNGIGIAYKF